MQGYLFVVASFNGIWQDLKFRTNQKICVS